MTRLLLPLGLLGAALTLSSISPTRAQTPAPEPEDTVRHDGDAGVATPRERPRREPRVVDAGVPVPPPDAGPADEPAARPPVARESADAGVPDADVESVDAGPTDMSVPAAPVATLDVRSDAGVAPAPEPVAPAPSTTTIVQWPVPFAPPAESTDPWAGLREIIPGIPTGGIGPLGLLALLALLALISGTIEKLRGRLLREGWLPTLLSFTQVCARLLALLIALALLVQVVPANVRWVVYFILMASGVALGWSMRDVMPDLIAGIVIVFERRIRRGIGVRSNDFSGAVERIGLRASWLRDSRGHRLVVPNRMLIQIPIVSDEEGDTVQEVVLRLGGEASAADVRRALHDAVLASPWTTPHCEPQVLRDPLDPELWQVRARLLSASFASAFQGQLLERTEAHLAALDKRENPDKTEHPEGTPETPRAR